MGEGALIIGIILFGVMFATGALAQMMDAVYRVVRGLAAEGSV